MNLLNWIKKIINKLNEPYEYKYPTKDELAKFYTVMEGEDYYRKSRLKCKCCCRCCK